MEADTATTGTPQRDPALVAELNDLIQLDHDAVEGYTVAINALKSDAYREQLVAFRADHKRHIEELGACVRLRGGMAAEMPHPTGLLKIAVQGAGAAGALAAGDPAVLLAFKAMEGQTRDKYRRAAARPFPPDVAEVVQRAAADEEKHYEWVHSTLEATGHGEGTAHGMAARAVEGINKLIADPMERVGREVMRMWEENRPKR